LREKKGKGQQKEENESSQISNNDIMQPIATLKH
jgi:hypothetical protein